MELKERARVHGQWGDAAVRDQPGAGTQWFSDSLFGSQGDSRSARWFCASRAPDASFTGTGCSSVNGLGSEKLVRIKFPAGEPEGPEREQDFALGVQPRMSDGTGVAQGSLVEVPDRTGTGGWVARRV